MTLALIHAHHIGTADPFRGLPQDRGVGQGVENQVMQRILGITCT